MTQVIAVCDGPQASLVCLAAATTPDAVDGIVLGGLVPDFEPLIRFGADPYVDIPYGMYITPDLARLATPDGWLAALGSRSLAVVGAGPGRLPALSHRARPRRFAAPISPPRSRASSATDGSPAAAWIEMKAETAGPVGRGLDEVVERWTQN